MISNGAKMDPKVFYYRYDANLSRIQNLVMFTHVFYAYKQYK